MLSWEKRKIIYELSSTTPFIWTLIIFPTGAAPPPQSAPQSGYGYNQAPKTNYNFTANENPDPGHTETAVRDSFGDYSSFSDKAVRRGFIRKVIKYPKALKEICNVSQKHVLLFNGCMTFMYYQCDIEYFLDEYQFHWTVA